MKKLYAKGTRRTRPAWLGPACPYPNLQGGVSADLAAVEWLSQLAVQSLGPVSMKLDERVAHYERTIRDCVEQLRATVKERNELRDRLIGIRLLTERGRQ